MTQHIPEWILIRYAQLWKTFKTNDFFRTEAETILPKDTSIAVVLSTLRKTGWLTIRLDEHDARKTVYTLKNPKQAIMETIGAITTS